MSNGIYTNEQHWREIGGKTVVTIGAKIEPVEIKGKWHWIVTEFVDDTFWDGMNLNVVESGNEREELVSLDDEDVCPDDEENEE